MNTSKGAKWIRADFHLHTRADEKWFKYKGEVNTFVNNYVQKLKDENIGVGIITNHNKFNKDEYKAIRKKAKKENIYILPGVELNVKEGLNGIHTLIVFEPETWLENGVDYINQFLTKTEPPNNNDFKFHNDCSNHNLLQTIDLLNKYEKPYFIVLAHVSSDNGFFNELGGKQIENLAKKDLFKENIIAFQAIKNIHLNKSKNWIDKLPALVEGSDPKSIEDIGKGKQCFIKLSAYNFDAVKYALLDHKYRIANEIPKHENAFIKSIKYETGKLADKTIFLNPAMNNLIGIRGGGKSSVLETLRYALDIELKEETSEDFKYKNKIVTDTLGAGGKIIFEIEKNDKKYTFEKGTTGRAKCVNNPELKVTIKSFYFGQKDLSKIGQNNVSNKEFVYRLIGELDKEQKIKTNEIVGKIRRIYTQILEVEKKTALIPDVKSRIAELKQSIEDIEKFGLKEKLEKEINFNNDADKIKYIKSEVLNIINQYEEFSANQLKDFDYLKAHKSKENKEIFVKLFSLLDKILVIQKKSEQQISDLKVEFENIGKLEQTFNEFKAKLETEFREKQRESNISAKDIQNYQQFQSELNTKKLQLTELKKLIPKKDQLQKQFKDGLIELKSCWKAEFDVINNQINIVNSQQNKLKIEIKHKDDKEWLMKEFFKLTYDKITQNNIQNTIKSYDDLIDLYFDYEKGTIPASNQEEKIKQQFYEKLPDFVTLRIPDTYQILYDKKPLKEYSLGQRASALIVFLLSLPEIDIILIDQPEDDLDSRTIYEEVISKLKDLKNKTQFIFATHNPNIPVLGDCEQVIVCEYDNNQGDADITKHKINLSFAGIDNKDIQKNIIKILEGGESAFEERKQKYMQWKH